MKAIFKDYLRTITKSLNRFISIVLIIAVGAGFYAGLKSTGPDMRLTADEYYLSSDLMDLKIFGNYNIDDGDIEVIQAMDGIKFVTGEYSLDAFNKTTGDNLHVMSLPDAEKGLNKITLKSGKLPENSDECVVDYAALGKTYKIGDTVELYLKDGDISTSLNKTKFTVVGTVTSPIYMSNSRGVSSIGTGTSDGFVMLNDDSFAYDYYTEAFVKLEYGSELSSFSNEYQDFSRQRQIAIENILRENNESRYNRLAAVHEKEIELAEKDVEKAKEQIKLCEQNLDESNIALNDVLGMVELSENELTDMENSINQKKVSIEQKIIQIDNIKKDADKIQLEIEAEEIILAEERKTIDADEEDYLIEQKLHASEDKTDGFLVDMRIWRERLDKEISQWEQKRIDLDNKIGGVQNQLNTIPSIEQEINTLKTQIDQEQVSYDEAISLHENKATIISDNEKIVEQSEKDLLEAKQTLENNLNDIEASKVAIESIGHIYYFVVDRTSNANYGEYGSNAERIDAIAVVFPIFFIVIAALVCLTTMTRMVEEETTLIGTYKAIGYSNSSIVGKYLVYAFSATIIGNIVGLNIGFRVFPTLIMNAYGLLYNMPSPETPFRWDYSLGTTLVGMACTMLSAFAACYNELRAVPAQLMRPKAPKNGKRILLERITFLWKMLGFNAKITLRNLFRYKRRMVMTIFGIAGCTALMLTGLGFRNSLLNIVQLQYDDIFGYDIMVTIDDISSENEREQLNKAISDSNAKSFGTYQKTIDVMKKDDRITTSLIVGSSENDIQEFISLRTRENKQGIAFDSNSVILSEKLALLLDVSEGDTFALFDTDNNQYQATVSAITENYAGHFIYMGDFIYSQYFVETPDFTTILIKSDSESIDNIAEKINDMDFVRESQLTSVVKSRYEDQIASMNIIVYVLIISAALLAFVVMFNLTSINVSERMRELSTIKVLGFYDNEVSGYIGRENIILTAMGIAVGLFAGTYLFQYVVSTAEVDTMMFGRTIQPLSFIISAGLTLIFTVIVNLGMHFSLKKIDMVGALKSIE